MGTPSTGEKKREAFRDRDIIRFALSLSGEDVEALNALMAGWTRSGGIAGFYNRVFGAGASTLKALAGFEGDDEVLSCISMLQTGKPLPKRFAGMLSAVLLAYARGGR